MTQSHSPTWWQGQNLYALAPDYSAWDLAVQTVVSRPAAAWPGSVSNTELQAPPRPNTRPPGGPQACASLTSIGLTPPLKSQKGQSELDFKSFQKCERSSAGAWSSCLLPHLHWSQVQALTKRNYQAPAPAPAPCPGEPRSLPSSSPVSSFSILSRNFCHEAPEMIHP